MQTRIELEQQAKALGMDLSYQPDVSMNNIELLPDSYWHKARQMGLGGSNEGALNGISHFNTLTEVMYEKVLGKKAAVSDDLQFIFDYGHAMEWVLLKRYATLNGYKFLTYKDYFVIVESSDDVSKVDSRFELAMQDIYSFKTRNKEAAEKALADISKKYPEAHIEEQESNSPKDVREITPEEHALYDKQGIVCVDRRQYRHSIPNYNMMLGDMDGLCITPNGEHIGLECKTYSYDQKKYQAAYESGVLGESGKIGKEEYIYQVQHYMAVLNLDRFDLIACCGNKPTDMTVTTIYRDLAFEQQLCDNCEEKWQKIQTLDVQEDEVDNKHYADIKANVIGQPTSKDLIELSDSYVGIVEDILDLDKQIADLKAKIESKEAAKNAKELEVIKAMNEHSDALIELPGDYNYEITYKPSKSMGGFDSAKLKANLPDIYEQYKKPVKPCTPTLKCNKRMK